MGVKSNLPEVRARRQAVFAGDEGRVKAQKDLGKLTARERLTALFDAASFVELNALNEDAGVVAGFGTIDGRGAYAFAQDFTVGLGAVGDAHAKKIAKVVDLARDSGWKKAPWRWTRTPASARRSRRLRAWCPASRW